MRDDPLGGSARLTHHSALWVVALVCSLPTLANGMPAAELADLSIEELANIEVTSASKQAESLALTSASLFVITGEDLRRSGKTTLPEALRLAPNLQVARIDARNYAISARGMNDAFTNKMLVLIDGRVIYSPLFSGVFWDAQDVVLEDIARIEVISGPGATQWGANAVNGVINIISKRAQDTQGGLLSLDRSHQQGNGVIRWGGALPANGHFRLYAKHAEQDDTYRANSTRTATGMRRNQYGFRADWDGGFRLQGDTYQAALHQAGTRNILTRGHNLLGSWGRTLAQGGQFYLQAYIDRTRRDQPGAYIDELNTTELEFQHHQPLNAHHRLSWGAGYRQAKDHIRPQTRGFAFLPVKQDLYWGHLYVQDEISLSDTLRLILGVKLERNNYSGLEAMPNLRWNWAFDDKHQLWGAVSRAVRAPSRIDRDFYVPAVAPYLIAGGPNFAAETADTAELGYRGQPSVVLSYSATLFYTRYDKLRSGEPNPSGAGNAVLSNKIAGHITGMELWGNWQVMPSWRLSGGWVAQHKRLSRKADSRDNNGAQNMGADPNHYWSLRSQHDLAANMTLDLALRRVGAIPRPAVPAYTTLDASWSWSPQPGLELALTAQNLLGDHHPEFASAPTRSEYGREAHVQLRYRF